MEKNLFKYIWHHSRAEQIGILFLVLVSLPFYFLSLDLAPVSIFDGFELEQEGLLFAFSFAFLALVLVNGGFKYVINTRKGRSAGCATS
jgi:putative ABC transport system ATP-binding protein